MMDTDSFVSPNHIIQWSQQEFILHTARLIIKSQINWFADAS